MQIATVFLALVAVLSAAGLYGVGALQRQLTHDVLVDMAGRLELMVERMHAQGMNYARNAPRDHSSYSRDLELYYQDLISDVAAVDAVVQTFMSGDFKAAMPEGSHWLRPRLSAEVLESIADLEDHWDRWRDSLSAALGDTPDRPRLEQAAAHVSEGHADLVAATRHFASAVRAWRDRGYRIMTRGVIGIAVLTLTLVLALLGLLLWKVLTPLRTATVGFQRVADGDFGYRLPVLGATEIQHLTGSFNRLSERLDLFYQLMSGLQQGQDLDDLVGLLGSRFAGLLGCDWIGVVLIDDARASARVETSWLDGAPLPKDRRLYRLQGTLLEQVLADEHPLHVQQMAETARDNPAYELLRHLVALGMRDALFLPITPRTQSPVPAVVVFASREADGLSGARRGLLHNSAQMLVQAFGRTARFAEQGRLAAIGELVSGIVHELRTPLTTVSMALAHVEGRETDPRAKRRLALGMRECERMRRLLEEMLLYAKPLSFEPRALDPRPLLTEVIGEARERWEHVIEIETETHRPEILGDPDRLRQIFVNLTENACEAAPEGAEITWRIDTDRKGQETRLRIQNPGETIPEHLLPRLTQPFFSTKSGGTGLGLAIVQRLVELHGGRLVIRSTAQEGTCVELYFPGLV
ncbi:HAMP domain-containing protein [Thiorhodococcus minor]|uniref:histidine kinase n=1 Tax=Thiorhodococcus minor TaxID=57489 RepID=A0A6M0K8Y9_9GAMM|nr:HAMP domain-containing protein [Thiorhodococcus minor]